MPSAPGNATASADGRSIWFDMALGNPYGNAIWSLDLASGALTQRSIRSVSGKQYAPAFSPDGNWLLMQEVGLKYIGALLIYNTLCAVRLTGERVDTESLQTAIRNGSGDGFTANSRAVWF